jgi:hypothetical protein
VTPAAISLLARVRVERISATLDHPVRTMSTTIVFGAFDRHNLGDLLFAHVAAALLPRDETVIFAGLAARDLRPFGGHRVEALHALRDDTRLRGARLLHAGGEILTCRARDAAVMLLDPAEVDGTLAGLAAHPADEPAWRRTMLGTDDELPYVIGRDAFRWLASVSFAGVGGVALDALPAPVRAALLERLVSADALTVRDAVTQAQLHAAGVVAPLMPDPAELVEALFGDAICARVTEPVIAELREAFPGGWLAVQLSTEFADDATLAAIATQLEAVPDDAGLGIVLFRAGAAPWHDDPALLARLARRIPARHVRVFESLDVWDLCALLAHAHACLCSSLHGGLVARAFGVPALGIEPPRPAQGRKLTAYVSTWHARDAPVVRHVVDIGASLRKALADDPAPRLAHAAERASRALEALRGLLAPV